MTGTVLLNCNIVTYHNTSNTDIIKAMGVKYLCILCFASTKDIS